jgi:hypothetical protein
MAHRNVSRQGQVGGESSHRGQLRAVRQVRRPDTRSGALDLESLDTLIVQEWTKTLRGPFDWGDWPLARYTLGVDVLQAAAQMRGATGCARPATGGLAWVCAMVACGRAPRLRSIDPRPLLNDTDGTQLVRADGAHGWHCNVERDAREGPQLHYWIHPSGLIEFDTVTTQSEPCPA